MFFFTHHIVSINVPSIHIFGMIDNRNVFCRQITSCYAYKSVTLKYRKYHWSSNTVPIGFDMYFAYQFQIVFSHYKIINYPFLMK